MIDDRFAILGALFGLIGAVSYIKDTISGKVKPNRVSWFMWALAPLIAFAAQLDKGVGWTSVMTFSVGFNPLLIFMASFVNKKSEWKLERLDVICGVSSFFGLILWMISREANVAIFFALTADILASIPTLVKSYKFPETENYKVFLFGMGNSLIALLTIREWNFETASFPIYIFAVTLLLVYLIAVRPKMSGAKK
jgi:hypothetical protein